MKRTLSIVLAIITVICTISILTSCGNTKSKFVGDWKEEGGTHVITFYDNGDCEMMKGENGTWDISDNKYVTVTIEDTIDRYEFKFEGKKLILSQDGDVVYTLEK